MKKRIMGLLLSVVMLFSLLPVSAFAVDSELNCSISLKLADGYSAYRDQFNNFNSEHKKDVKAIQPTTKEEADCTIISWTVPPLEGWKVTGAEISIMDNTGGYVKEDGTLRGFDSDGNANPYDMPYTLSGNTITLTYTGEFKKIVEVDDESQISGKITLKILIAPMEEKTTAPVTYSYVNQSEERVSSETDEWQAIANQNRNPKQTEVLLGEDWTIPLNDSIELPYSGNVRESWRLTGCVVTINGKVTDDEFIPVEDLQAGKTVAIPNDATSVNVAYYWMISGVTNIIKSIEHVVKQNEQTLEPRKESTPDTYIVNGKDNVVVDYTAKMDMSKLDSKFGTDSWAWLNEKHEWITDETTVLLHFTFDSNLDVVNANWDNAELESDMFVLAGEDFYEVSGQEVTVTCNWNGAKAAAALESKQELDNIIIFTGVTIPVKSDWEGDTVAIKSSGYVDGTVHATIVYGNNTTYSDQGGIYGGYKSDTFALTTQVTLSYDANGGEGSMDSQTYKVGENATVAQNGFTRSGYTFTGWKTQADGNGTEYQAGYTIEMPANDVVLYAQWIKNYTVTYDLNNGTAKPDVDYTEQTVSAGSSVTVKDAPSRSGYTFAGWSDGTTVYRPGDELTVTQNITLTAQWDKDAPVITYVVLHYESNGGTVYRDESYAYGTTVKLDKIPTREGYTFTGWYADEALTERITSIKMTGNKTVYAGWAVDTVPDMLNGDDHFAYIIGYDDGTVRPNANITRAEAATIFFRLLKDEVRDGNLTDENDFSDVSEDAWYNKAVSTMSALGIVKGRTATTFAPDAYITRAELAAICARFDTGLTDGDSSFTDISGHWAEAEIERAAMLGWINGYPDGTFRPDQPITRAEAMTLINRVLCRIPEDEDDLLDGMNEWPDNQPGEWYYLAVQEATNSHDFKHKGEIYETWTKLTSDPDWTRYQ